MRTLVLIPFLAAALLGPDGAAGDERLATIRLLAGFEIEPFAEVPNARQMAWGRARHPLRRHPPGRARLRGERRGRRRAWRAGCA